MKWHVEEGVVICVERILSWEIGFYQSPSQMLIY